MVVKRYRIVYEDDWLIIVDKPSGMLVIPTPKKETDTLTDLLNQELDARGVEVNAYPSHRLDRETSGLIIYAKGKAVQHLMMNEFRKRTVRKAYIAFVQGIVRKDVGTVKNYIYNRNKKRNDLAITRYKVVERRKSFTVLEVEPVTGRTNQIRIHMKKIGHPLVGESVYAFRKDFELKFRRTALHAGLLEFTHPIIKRKLAFVSRPPEDMETFLQR